MSSGADPDERDDRRLREVIQGSSELIGAVGGGAIGLVGGPAGAMAGAAAGVVITRTVRRVGLEVYERLLVPRQQERVGAVLGFTIADAERAGATGEELRADGFFEGTDARRSDAEEILEGVLLHAANAYQESKLRHLGAILPSLAVRPDVSAADGHWLIQLADRLTWRQLVVLSIFSDPPAECIAERDVHHEESGDRGPTGGLRDEVEELGALGLVGVIRTDGAVVRAGGTWGSTGSIWGTPLGQWRLTTQGRLIVEMAKLDQIDDDMRGPIMDELLL